MKLEISDITLKLGENIFRYNTLIENPVTGIFGHSGAGKTTLINTIAGITKPASGSITFNGKTFFSHSRRVNVPVNRRNIGVVFQEHYLFPHLSVLKNLTYSTLYTKDKEIRINLDSVIQLLDIGHLLQKKPLQLSGGERQRVAIGRTLLSQPELLLMDEPFSNLDKMRRREIIRYLLKINRQYSIPLIIISHDLDDILKLTNSLIVLKEGRIEASGSYLDIADSKQVPGLIDYESYVNIHDLYCSGSSDRGTLLLCTAGEKEEDVILKTGPAPEYTGSVIGHHLRLSIFPDDIVLSKHPLQETSIQNQLHGTVIKLRHVESACFVTINCGITLVAEVTGAAALRMKLEEGMSIYCLIKAKAVSIIHVYRH